MSRQISTTVLPVQRVMADATPTAWLDGFVADSDGVRVTVRLLDGSVSDLRVVGRAEVFVAGDPVAYHPVAEILSAGRLQTTARRI